MPWRGFLKDPLSYSWVPQYLTGYLRGAVIRARYALDRRVEIGSGFVVEGPFKICGEGRVRIGHGVKVRRSNTYPVCIRTLAPDAQVTIGDGSELGGVQILCGKEVILGERTLAANCRIQDTDFANLELDKWPGSVRTGKGVWLGLTSILLKGAEVGDWAIVAAGSVVERAVEGLALAMGNPARPIRGVFS